MNFKDFDMTVFHTMKVPEHFNTKYQYTRNRNMPNERCLFRKMNEQIETNRLQPYRASAYSTKFPEFGVNVGHIPLQDLHKNGVYYESELQIGIEGRNCNYTNSDLVPLQSTKMDKIKFFDKPESNNLIPRPLVLEKNQRPIIP